MSEQVQSIVDAVLRLTADQRRELEVALAALEASRPEASVSRQQLVDSIRGKYRHVSTSSESFMKRKREEVALESRS